MTREDNALRPSWWVRALAALPMPVLHGISRLFAFLAWRVSPYEVRVVRDSLRIAFPDLHDHERERLRRDFYRGYGDVMVEIIRSAAIDGHDLDRRMRFANLEVLREAIRSGGPALLLAAHQCNWEWILLGLSRNLGFPVDAAYKPLKNPWADREMRSLRSRFGARMVPAERVMRDLIARRSVPRLVALVADQEPVASDRRHWTHFLNRETAFYMGADVIAATLDYPVYFVAIVRTGRGRYEASFELLRARGERLVPGELTERYARRVERQIHASPADWPWSHKRWRLRRQAAERVQPAG
jgi:KDO2-lipid IV(A) lauroyltransferase